MSEEESEEREAEEQMARERRRFATVTLMLAWGLILALIFYTASITPSLSELHSRHQLQQNQQGQQAVP